MDYIRAKTKNAENVKRKIIRRGILDRSAPVKHSKSYVYFPVVIGRSRNKKVGVRRGYDILGNIAVIDFDGTREQERGFARQLLERHASVKTVLAKAGAVRGRYRTREFRHVLGKRNFVAEYRENGCAFRFDVRKTFFSNRLSFERARINGLVKKGENVMVFFSGVGPFAIEIAKAHRDATVVGIELNRYASRMANENAGLNRVANVKLESGDVRKLSKDYRNFADRIVVPMPKQSLDFLDEILAVAKRNARVHLYAFGMNESAYSETAKALKAHAEQNGYRIRVDSKRVVRPYSPKEVEIAMDYTIRK
jgi:tRNA (guanine37-N1)-methyltransferase